MPGWNDQEFEKIIDDVLANDKALETLGKLSKVNNGIFRDTALVLEARYYERTAKFIEVVHNGQWQHKVISFLKKQGVAVDFSKVVDRTTYRAAIRTHGLP